MKMKDIIDGVSAIYREECKTATELRKELDDINFELFKAKNDNWKNISHNEYCKLTSRKEYLEEQSHTQAAYCRGISLVREYLMDLGFDTDISK